MARSGPAPRTAGSCLTTLPRVSKRIQETAREREPAARERARKARDRAHTNEDRGNDEMARIHRGAADLQADVAEDAKALRELDQRIEGDQLG